MHAKLVLPSLDATRGRLRRHVKYSLFPPLGLATLAAYLRGDDDVTLVDENVERLDLSDQPDLVAIEVYTTSARRAYQIADHYRAKGTHVALGGLHVTAVPGEAARHADTVFLGPGEDTWPAFLSDFRAGRPGKRYQSTVRSLSGVPPIRRDLIKRDRYLAANSLVVSRGCPHSCDFCTNSTFFRGGKSFYAQPVEEALGEIERLPGRHLYFLDDHLFGNRQFAFELLSAMRGMNRVWQAAGTVRTVFDRELLDLAVASGLRTLLVGFETLSEDNLRNQHKRQNVDIDYSEAVRRFRDAGVFVNATFVFGMDDDDETVFDRTVEWAVNQGVETATFHILTPYPGTVLHQRLAAAGRVTSRNWDLYDTRHVVFEPSRMSAERLRAGYHRAYRDFYRATSIVRSASHKVRWQDRVRHAIYASAWGKSDLWWNAVVRSGRIGWFTPLLTAVLDGAGAVHAANSVGQGSAPQIEVRT